MNNDRFDLEQQILQAWQITDDILILTEQDASMEDMVSLATVYEYKFQRLWKIFETMVHDKKIGV